MDDQYSVQVEIWECSAFQSPDPASLLTRDCRSSALKSHKECPNSHPDRRGPLTCTRKINLTRTERAETVREQLRGLTWISTLLAAFIFHSVYPEEVTLLYCPECIFNASTYLPIHESSPFPALRRSNFHLPTTGGKKELPSPVFLSHVSFEIPRNKTPSTW